MKFVLKKIATKRYLYIFFGICFAFLGGAYFYHYYQNSKGHLVSQSDRTPQGVGTILAKGALKIKTRDTSINTKIWDKLKTQDLKGLDFQKSWWSPPLQINQIRFDRSNFQNSRFENILINKTSFLETKSQGVDFSGGHISNTTFRKAKLHQAHFWYDLTSEGEFNRKSALLMKRVIFQSAELPKAKFIRVSMRNVSFTGAKLPGAVFRRVGMRNVNFVAAKLDSVKFDQVNFHDAVDFTGADLKNATFFSDSKKTTYSTLSFKNADLRGASFRNIRLLTKGVNLKGAKYNSSTRFPEGFTEKMAKDKGMIKLQ